MVWKIQVKATLVSLTCILDKTVKAKANDRFENRDPRKNIEAQYVRKGIL